MKSLVIQLFMTTSYSSFGAALYIGCWSCTNYGAARAAPAVWLSPAPMPIQTGNRQNSLWSLSRQLYQTTFCHR